MRATVRHGSLCPTSYVSEDLIRADKVLEAAGWTLERAARASEVAGRVSEVAGKASKDAARALEVAGGPWGIDTGKRKGE